MSSSKTGVSPEEAIERLVASLMPGARVMEVRPLAPDSGTAEGDATAKVAGYGLPLRIRVQTADQGEKHLVFRTTSADDFGHDRPSDRAQGMLLAYDAFPRIPRHVEAVDVGAVLQDGRVLSLRDATEHYLLTTYAPGALWADGLRRIAREGEVTELDLQRCDALAQYLLDLHRPTGGRSAVYRRAIRDLLGHGEGIFGIVDGYPPDVPGAPAGRLQAIERRCWDWRWRLRGKEDRLVRMHGDFHPFNVIFDEGTNFSLLDASRGCEGDRADDVTCLAINFVFFALEHPSSWAQGLGVLWRRFWGRYLDGTEDKELLRACPPYLAWRGLVLACPTFYPAMKSEARNRLLGFVERALAEGKLEPSWAEELF